MAEPTLHIDGGADEREAAAIAAAVAWMLDEERRQLQRPKGPPQLSTWAATGRTHRLPSPHRGAGPSRYADPLPEG